MSARPLFIPEAKVQSSHEAKPSESARPLSMREKDIPRLKSLINAPIKGLSLGTLGFAKMAVFLADLSNLPVTALTGKSAYKPIHDFLEKSEKRIEEKLPTQPEFAEESLIRAGKLLPGAGLGSASLARTAISSALGGVAGQSVQEAGGSPIVQALAESVPFAAPSLAKAIIPKNAEQNAILNLGRRNAMSEEQLAPLIPEAGKKRFFGKFAFGGGKGSEQVMDTKKAVQGIYQAIENSPAAKKNLTPEALNKFVTSVDELAIKMPHAIRSQLKNDALDLVKQAQKKGGLSGEELINFYSDVSSHHNIGKPQLELFKNPIREALHSIDPALAKDFNTVNKMYQRAIQIGRILKPSEFENLISLGEAYELGASVANLDPGRLRRLLGVVGFRKFSEKMLTSPRLQNLIKKSQIAIEKNNRVLLKKVGEEIADEFKEQD